MSFPRFLCLFVALGPGCAPILSQAADQKGPTADEQFLADIAKLSTGNADLLKLLRERCRFAEALRNPDLIVRQLGHPVFARREAATRDLKAMGAAALPALRATFDNADQEIARRARECAKFIEATEEIDWIPSAIRLLVSRRATPAFEVLLDYLPFTTDPDVEEEIYCGLDEFIEEHAGLLPRLARRLTDPRPARRAVAACILARRGDTKQRAQIRTVMEKDADPHVRLRAAQGLLAVRDAACVPVLIELLSLDSILITWQAEELLRWAAGETAPKEIIGKGTKTERERCQAAWGDWWRKHNGTFRFYAVALQGSGPRLVLAWGSKGDGEGPRDHCIWLLGCDGLPRYELFPERPLTLVGWLPEGKLLVVHPRKNERKADAEVRTMAGDIRNKFILPLEPDRCQRLPSGDIQIAGHYFFERMHVVCDPGGRIVRTKVAKDAPRRVDPAASPPTRFWLRNGNWLQPGGGGLREQTAAERVVWEAFTEYTARPINIFPLVRFGFRLTPDAPNAIDLGAHLIRGLKHPSATVRLYAITRLKELPLHDRVFDAAMSALLDPNISVARNALAVLPQSPGRCQEALPKFIALLGEEHIGRPGLLSDVFRVIGPEKAIPALVDTFEDRRGPEVSARRAAAIYELTACWLDTHFQVRSLAKQALRDPDVAVRSSVASALSVHPKADLMLHELIKAIDDPERDVAYSAIGAFQLMGKAADSAIPALLKAMKKRHFRWGVVSTFGSVGIDDPAVFAALMTCLQDREDPNLIAITARAMWPRAAKAKTVVPEMVKVLEHEWKGKAAETVQLAISMALGKMGPDARGALPILESLLAAPNRPSGHHFFIVEDIARIDPAAGKRARVVVRRRLGLTEP